MNTNERLENSPVLPDQRVVILDVLRGFSLFGILMVNMSFFNNSVYSYVLGFDKPVNVLDQFGRLFISFFCEGKFYTIFAFMFGLGMAIQMLKAYRNGRRFVPFFLRRMLVLMLIGIVHGYLIWSGDILILYSILGIAALVFRNCRPRTLFIWMILLLFVPLFFNGALIGLIEVVKMSAEGEKAIVDVFADVERTMREDAEKADHIYGGGTFGEITAQRVRDMNFMFSIWPFMAFNVLAMFLLGLIVGKKGIIDDLEGHGTLIRRIFLSGLVVGIVGNGVYTAGMEFSNRIVPSWTLLCSLVGQTIGGPAFALFYMTGLILLFQKSAWRERLKPLALTGRMAITNYILQSVMCTLLFYGYGAGLYGKIGVFSGIVVTVVIFLIQVRVSVWWLNRFRFGPVEWLWRSLTYGSRQPMNI